MFVPYFHGVGALAFAEVFHAAYGEVERVSSGEAAAASWAAVDDLYVDLAVVAPDGESGAAGGC